jgi:hypothetical protein
MIHDMASLKKAMEQMDADDMATSQAAKDRAAQILSANNLSFSKMAELIEQRRLLLRPKIVASIKRMDQPEMMGDAAFRDAGTSLRREGQSFRQIAEALEVNAATGSQVNAATGTRNEDITSKGELLQQQGMDGEPHVPRWLRALAFGTRVFFYPLRHPIRTMVIALILFMLVNTFRGFVGVGRQVSGYVADVSSARQRADSAASSVSAFFQKLKRPSQDAAAPLTPPAPIPSPSPSEASSATPSPGPTVASAPPAATPTPQASPASPANEAAASPTTPALPPTSTPRPDMRSSDVRSSDVRSSPSSSVASNNRPRMAGPRAFEDLMPTEFRRHSRSAGPCVSGAGGCYWGGTRY